MKNRDYWKQRAKIAEHTSHSMSVETTKKVLRSFNAAERNIQKEIESWYQRFAVNNEISLAEARKLLNSKELDELKWDVNEYIKKGQENAVNGKWIKELENASARAHISRLEALQLRMRQQCEVAFADEETQTQSLLENVYKDGFYRSAYEIQKGLGIAFEIGALDNERVQKVISRPWTIDGATFSDRIWKHKTQLISDLHTGIIQSFVRGEAPDRLIKEISKKFNTSKYNAGRLIQTEQAFFYTQSQRDLYKQLGVEEYEIAAVFDFKTCEICQDMDGVVVKKGFDTIGATIPPFHPNCRCVLIPYFDDWNELGIDVRRAAREDGKTIHIGGNLTYKEWKPRYIKGLHSYKSGERVYFNEKADYNINIVTYSESTNNAISKSIKKVAKYGSENNYEYASIIDLSTNKEVHFGTSKSEDSVGSYLEFLRNNKNGKYALIHNHNRETTLSLPDIMELTSCENIDSVIAVSNNGLKSVVISNGKRTNDYLWNYYDKEVKKLRRQKLSDTEIEIKLVEKASLEFSINGMEIIDGRN